MRRSSLNSKFALLLLLVSLIPSSGALAQLRTPTPHVVCIGCATVSIVSGNAQTGRPSSVLPNLLTVRLTFNFTGAPIAGAPVDFALTTSLNASGTLLSTTNGLPSGSPIGVRALTDINGIASVQLKLGDAFGPYNVDTSCGGCIGATFFETAFIPSPTFSITDLSLQVGGVPTVVRSPAPVQVVFNPHISPQPILPPVPDPGPFDLVAGKSTGFIVGIAVDNVSLVQNPGVEVDVAFGSLPPQSVLVAPQCSPGQIVNCFQSNGAATVVVNTGFAPQTSGLAIPVVSTVNPAGPNHVLEGNGSNAGQNATVLVNVKRTNDSGVGYFGVDGCAGANVGPFCHLSPQAPSDVIAGNDFITRTFPLSDSSVPPGLDPSLSLLADPHPIIGKLVDLHALRLLALGLPSPPPQVIGIVPKNYFASHGLSHLSGLTWGHASLVVEGTDAVAAHELSHQLGILDLPEEYVTATPLPGNHASGFSIPRNMFVTNAFCFMGNQRFAESPSQMGPTWVDNAHFGFLFSQLLSVPGDPEVLLFGAVVHKSGQVDLLRSARFAKGYLDASVPGGNYSVVIADATGAILSQTAVSVSFDRIVDPVTLQIQSEDTALISVEVPFSPRASTISLLRGGTSVARINAASKLLADAVKSLSEAAFGQSGGARRNSILGMIASLDLQLSRGAFHEAGGNLRNNIRPAVQNWLLDNYVPGVPLETTKIQLLALIDELGQGL